MISFCDYIDKIFIFEIVSRACEFRAMGENSESRESIILVLILFCVLDQWVLFPPPNEGDKMEFVAKKMYRDV